MPINIDFLNNNFLKILVYIRIFIVLANLLN